VAYRVPFGRARLQSVHDRRRVSGKQEVIDILKPFLPGFRFRSTHLSRLETVSDPGGPSGNDPVARAVVADVAELVDLYCRIDEFETKHRREAEIASMTRTISEGTGRYYFVRRDGRIVSAAATVAENTSSAMVVGVATDPAYRGQGLASRVVTGLCRDVLAGGRTFLCLFYDNPSAGAIYRRIGFQETGIWVMGTPQREEGNHE
jgi:predicted GNAT family acetyltransferase